MEDITYLVIWALMGYWCYRIAERKGRSKVLAVFMGILFSFVAVIVYYCIKPTKEVQVKNAKKLLEGDEVKITQK